MEYQITMSSSKFTVMEFWYWRLRIPEGMFVQNEIWFEVIDNIPF